MTLEERLEKMEKKVKQNNLILLIGALLVVLIITTHMASRKDIVKARQFILLDKNGKTRAELSAVKDGPILALLDENGKVRAWLGADKDRPMVGLSDENGKVFWKAPPEGL